MSPVSTARWKRRSVITALRVIILLNKRCKLSECESVLPRAQHRLPIAQRSRSPSIISRPRQVKWDDCHCGEVVKYKMLHLFMKWKFEQPERGALKRGLPRNQPGGALQCSCQRGSSVGSHGPGGWRGPGEHRGVPYGNGAVPVTETARLYVAGGAVPLMLPAWGGQVAAGAACSARRAALGGAHHPGVAVQQPAMLCGTVPGVGTFPAACQGCPIRAPVTAAAELLQGLKDLQAGPLPNGVRA